MALNKGVIYTGEATREEHDDTANVELKRVGSYGWDADNLQWKRISTDVNGKVNVNAEVIIPPVTVDTTGLATDTNQTNGSQKTQIVDVGGEAVTVTGGKLDVNASVDTTGLALDTTLTGGSQKSQIVDAGGEAVTVTGGKLDVNASVDTTGLALETKQDTMITSLQLLDDAISGSEMQVDVLTMPTTTVTATDLDIRNLTSTDVVTVHGDVGVVDQLDLTNSNPVTVAIVDATGDQITSFGGGTQYTEGDIDATPTGTLMFWRDSGTNTQYAVSETNPLPISDNAGSLTVDDGGGALTVDGTVTVAQGTAANLNMTEANSAAIKTAVEIIDNAIAGSEMQVDVVTMPTTTVQATNLDVRDLTSVSDSVAVHGDVGVLDQIDLTNSNPAAVAIVDGNGDQITSFGGGTQYTEGDTDTTITGTASLVEGAGNALAVLTQPLTDTQLRATPVPVSGTFYQATQPVSAASLPLPTGAATSAKQDTIIGHVDGIEGLLTTIDSDTGNLSTIETNTDFGTVTGGGTETGALRVTLANNSTGLVSVDDNGGSLTVDGTVGVSGTVAVTQSGTWDEVGINDSGNSITVDNGGTFATQESGAALTALQLIDDTVYTDGTGTVTKGMAVLGQDGTNPQAIKTDSDGELQVDVLSMPTTTVQATNLDIRDLSSASDSVAIGGTVAVTQSGTWDEVGINDSGNSITVDDGGGALTVDGAVTVTNATAANLKAEVVGTGTFTTQVSSIAAGDNNIGNVDVVTMPNITIGAAIPAGTNNIGDVDVASIAAGTNAIGKVGHDITGIGHGVKTVTTAGTDVALATSTACKKVDIQAQTDNTNIIAVGGVGVDATIATGTGIVLYPGDVYSLEIDNLADVYIDSLINGEGVRFTYYT